MARAFCRPGAARARCNRPTLTTVDPMDSNDRWRGGEGEEGPEPVGIVVADRSHAEGRPHLDFVWGPPEVLPAPSLPFGRWKPGARAA
jgi:hypothetical protein